jgi:hypothetical protein
MGVNKNKPTEPSKDINNKDLNNFIDANASQDVTLDTQTQNSNGSNIMGLSGYNPNAKVGSSANYAGLGLNPNSQPRTLSFQGQKDGQAYNYGTGQYGTTAGQGNTEGMGTVASGAYDEGDVDEQGKPKKRVGDIIADNGNLIRGGINLGLALFDKPDEARLKQTTNIINTPIGMNENRKRSLLNQINLNANQQIRANQSTDGGSNIINSALTFANKNKAIGEVETKDSEMFQDSVGKFTDAKNTEQQRADDFHNKLEQAKAQGKNLARANRNAAINDFGQVVHQDAVEKRNIRNQNQTQQDEYEMLLGQEKIKGEHSQGLNESQLQLENDLKASKAKVETMTTRNKQLQATLTANPGDAVAKTEYDNNIAEIALEEGNQQVSGKYYQDWNSKNKLMNDKVSQFRLNQIRKGYNRVGKGIYEKNDSFGLNQQGSLFKSGGSLTLEEKKELESYKSNLKEGRDSKRDKVKDLRESLKESKLLAKELYKSSKEDRKEGNKLIMDFYKSIKNK